MTIQNLYSDLSILFIYNIQIYNPTIESHDFLTQVSESPCRRSLRSSAPTAKRSDLDDLDANSIGKIQVIQRDENGSMWDIPCGIFHGIIPMERPHWKDDPTGKMKKKTTLFFFSGRICGIYVQCRPPISENFQREMNGYHGCRVS